MKLIPKFEKYISPLPHQGEFQNAYIEDREIILKQKENYLAVVFVLAYLKEGKEVILYQKKVEFIGLESDYENSTNQTSYFRYPNPLYDADFVPDEISTEEDYHKTVEWIEKVKLMEYLAENEGMLPEGSVITEYGYPTYEAALNYFTGGTLESPEIHITNPLAIGFFLNKLEMNGQIVGEQFKFAE
jgi:hypothetical protein